VKEFKITAVQENKHQTESHTGTKIKEKRI